MKTYQPNLVKMKRKWHLVDANGQVLGRMASSISRFLTGKYKPTYSPNLDSGDFVVVVNASGVVVTGKKDKQKVYRKHSGYPGGMKVVKYSKLMAENPGKIIEHAVSGMLPDNRLKSVRMRRLKVFAKGKHKYSDKFKSK